MSNSQFNAPSQAEISAYVRHGRQLQAQAFASSVRKIASLPAAIFRK